MFWDKGYSPSQNIESLLQKENVSVEEFLEDEDILQECKTQKRNLIQYLIRPEVIKRLIEIVITEPPEDMSINQRFKYANVACEILTFGLPSLDEKLVDNDENLETLYSFLENEPPLNPLISSFFSKTFCMLISKKSEQDWFLYQKICLQVLEFIKSRGNFIELIFRHFETPVIMDLLLQIIRDVQGGTMKKNLYEWFNEQNLVQRLISILCQPEESEKHKNVAEFLCDLIKHGRNMRQTDQQESDAFERTFIGSNPLLQSIENEATITQLIDAICTPGSRESTIIYGIQIVLTLVDETIIDQPASDIALQLIIDKEKENHKKIVTTIINVIESRLVILHEILLYPPKNNDIITTAAKLSPPFGLTRLQICRLFTVLLKTNNDQIINAISKTEFLNTLLIFFKEYCWNNFLHGEVEKCLQFVFCSNDNNNGCTDANESDQQNVYDETNIFESKNETSNSNPTTLQVHAIVNCKIISKLIKCWMYNKEVQCSENGRRLGFMGHLIKIFNTVLRSMSKSVKLSALIESNLMSDELECWYLITDKNNGEFTNDFNTQNSMLANCNAYEASDFIKEFHSGDLFSQLKAIPDNLDEEHNSSIVNEAAFEKLCGFLDGDNLINCLLGPSNEASNVSINMKKRLHGWNNSDSDLDTDMDIFQIDSSSGLHTFSLNNVNPWSADPFTSNNIIPDNVDLLFSNNSDSSGQNATVSNSGWNNFMCDNFADFGAHFNSYSNDNVLLNASSPSDQGAGDSIENKTKLDELEPDDVSPDIENEEDNKSNLDNSNIEIEQETDQLLNEFAKKRNIKEKDDDVNTDNVVSKEIQDNLSVAMEEMVVIDEKQTENSSSNDLIDNRNSENMYEL